MNRQNNTIIRSLLLMVFLAGVLMGSVTPARAQLDPQISQHMFNRTYYNPSATGASNYLNVFLLARTQWVAWDGAPETQLASVHSYVPSIHSGLGVNFINDKMGFEKVQTLKLMYAYHLLLAPDAYLSLGIGGGVQYQSLDYTLQNPADPTDPQLVWNRESKWNPDFDFGAEFNYKQLKVGASVTHLGRNPSQDSPLSPGAHYYGYARYNIPINFDWSIAPSLFTQHSLKSTHFEGGALAFFRQLFWVGSFFRMDEQVDAESWVFMGGVHIGQFRVGYSFDYNLKYLMGYTNNSHELFVSWQFPYKTNDYDKTPRFFEE